MVTGIILTALAVLVAIPALILWLTIDDDMDGY